MCHFLDLKCLLFPCLYNHHKYLKRSISATNPSHHSCPLCPSAGHADWQLEVPEVNTIHIYLSNTSYIEMHCFLNLHCCLNDVHNRFDLCSAQLSFYIVPRSLLSSSSSLSTSIIIDTTKKHTKPKKAIISHFLYIGGWVRGCYVQFS